MDVVKKQSDMEIERYQLSDDIAKIKSPPQQNDFLKCTVFEHLLYKKPPEMDSNIFLEQFLIYG